MQNVRRMCTALRPADIMYLKSKHCSRVCNLIRFAKLYFHEHILWEIVKCTITGVWRAPLLILLRRRNAECPTCINISTQCQRQTTDSNRAAAAQLQNAFCKNEEDNTEWKMFRWRTKEWSNNDNSQLMCARALVCNVRVSNHIDYKPTAGAQTFFPFLQ